MKLTRIPNTTYATQHLLELSDIVRGSECFQSVLARCYHAGGPGGGGHVPVILRHCEEEGVVVVMLMVVMVVMVMMVVMMVMIMILITIMIMIMMVVVVGVLVVVMVVFVVVVMVLVLFT